MGEKNRSRSRSPSRKDRKREDERERESGKDRDSGRSERDRKKGDDRHSSSKKDEDKEEKRERKEKRDKGEKVREKEVGESKVANGSKKEDRERDSSRERHKRRRSENEGRSRDIDKSHDDDGGVLPSNSLSLQEVQRYQRRESDSSLKSGFAPRDAIPNGLVGYTPLHRPGVRRPPQPPPAVSSYASLADPEVLESTKRHRSHHKDTVDGRDSSDKPSRRSSRSRSRDSKLGHKRPRSSERERESRREKEKKSDRKSSYSSSRRKDSKKSSSRRHRHHDSEEEQEVVGEGEPEEEGEVNEMIFKEEEDEEEEERRLEEERKKRRERLAAAAAKAKAEENKGTEGASSPHAANGKPEEVDDRSDDDDTTNPIEILKVGAAMGSGDAGYAVCDTSIQRAAAGKEDRPVFDMFSASPTLDKRGATGVLEGPGLPRTAHARLLADEGDDPTLKDNWTDGEGYYRTRVGEVIEGRYKVLGTIGQGVFSTVLKCLDLNEVGKEVALKMIRANDTMRKAAQKEVAICLELKQHDPHSRRHCILMTEHLEHKNHVVMVFESMQMNLRETLKKFGRRVGINIAAVRSYAKQLFIALRHLAARRIIHADIKPDNILVSQGFGCLKLADFGSAFHETDPDNEPTPYLVSRWYRAPEIILGLEYDRAIDTWSVAVTLYELYMGSSLFPGRDNNEMLSMMMEVKGPFPIRMIKHHHRQFEKIGGLRKHFAEDQQFMVQEPDPITGKPKIRMVTVTAPSKTLRQLLFQGNASASDTKDMVSQFADFLDKCLTLDPKKRMSLTEAFDHPFLAKAN